MYRLFLIALFIILPFLGNPQLIPSYFKNPAFKAWISENNISSLTFHTLPSEHLTYTSGYYLAKNNELTYVDYPEPNRVPEFEVKMNIYEYLFDELGNLDSLCIKTMEIDCKAPEKDSFNIDLDFRERLNELIKADYSEQFKIDLSRDVNLRVDAQQVSKVLKECKYSPMNYFIDASGKTWVALQQSITIPGLKGTQVLDFRIEQTVKFKKEEPVFIREYPFIGDFWDPNYHYWSVVQLNDSVQTVFVQQSEYDYDGDISKGKARDTSYYSNSFILHQNGIETFYTKNDRFKKNYDQFPQIKFTSKHNLQTRTYTNYGKGASYSLFNYSGREITYFETLKYEMPVISSCEQSNCPILELREFSKQNQWNKTQFYYSSSPDEKLQLQYTEMPYESGVKREYREEELLYTDTIYKHELKQQLVSKYRLYKHAQYFEHKGKDFRIYSFYTGPKGITKTEIEISTNNGYLEIGKLETEYADYLLKMNIGYR